jgi:ribosome-associated heat shock protein Hsp15
VTDPTARATIRIDKWLWQARFFKTRSLAAKAVSDGRVRVNAARTDKPARAVGAGDVLTFAQGQTIRVVKVLDLGVRRGPASEAALLFLDMTPESPPVPPREGPRPTKKDRRALDTLRRTPLE